MSTASQASTYEFTTNPSAAVDVVVVGGGPAGVSTAVSLLRRGATVCIVSSPLPRQCLAGEAISPEGCAELMHLIPGKNLPPSTAVPCFGIEAAWGSPSTRWHSYLLNPLGDGIVVGRPAFHDLLWGVAHEAGAKLFIPACFQRAEPTGAGWTVFARSRCTVLQLRCAVLVDATGPSATVARSLGAWRVRSDTLCAVSAVLDFDLQQQMLSIGAAPYGWWYAAPLPDGRTLLCLFSDADILRALHLQNPRIWMEHLCREHSMAARLKGTRAPVSLRTHACATTLLDPVAGQNWLAVGDAGSTFDPLSAMGVLKAFRSGRSAADVIASCLHGSSTGFSEYALRTRCQFAEYLKLRHQHYALERRWTQQPFWSRRVVPARS